MIESVVALIAFSAFATYIWRAVGVTLGDRLDPDSALFAWLSCVAFALLAGLMSRILIFPVGVLAEAGIAVRLVPMVLGFGVFVLLRRNYLVATLVATVFFYVLFIILR